MDYGVRGGKSYAEWHREKAKIQDKNIRLNFSEREIWFVHLGSNIGREQDGKGNHFLRPVIVYKKWNKESFIAIPLSRTKKLSTYHFYFSYKDNTEQSVALLSQIRILDERRLFYKDGFMEMSDFNVLKEKIRQLLA